MLELTLRDAVWLAMLFISIVGTYWKLRMEINHLNDVKSDKEDVSGTLAQIKQTLVRVETKLDQHMKQEAHS